MKNEINNAHGSAQYFVRPFLNLGEEREKELIEVVDKIALELDGLRGFEMEFVIDQLRKQIFTLVKLDLSNGGHKK